MKRLRLILNILLLLCPFLVFSQGILNIEESTGDGVVLGLSSSSDSLSIEHSGLLTLETIEVEGAAFFIQIPI